MESHYLKRRGEEEEGRFFLIQGGFGIHCEMGFVVVWNEFRARGILEIVLGPFFALRESLGLDILW